MIRRRHVFYVAGFDPLPALPQYLRFVRELGVFARTWMLQTSAGPFIRSGRHMATWRVAAQGPGWAVNSTYELLLWDDLIEAQAAEPSLKRTRTSVAALWDLLCSGTLARYFRARPSYGWFILYPFLYVAGFVAVSAIAARAIVSLTELPTDVRAAAFIALGTGIFFSMLRFIGRRRRIGIAFDNLIFTMAHLRGKNTQLDRRLNLFARRLIEQMTSVSSDEILIVGHSQGATLAAEIVSRALRMKPDLGNLPTKLGVLTVASTIPKFTFHPDAERVRAATGELCKAPGLTWADIQIPGDPISFARIDPLTRMPHEADRFDSRPIVRNVALEEMFEPRTLWRFPLRTLWRFPKSLMRLHYQAVMANRKIAAYDYFMSVAGPLSFREAMTSPGGCQDLIARGGLLNARFDAEKRRAS